MLRESTRQEIVNANWPSFMQTLEPELSESQVLASIPDDAIVHDIKNSDTNVNSNWTGVWSGWGSKGRSVDVKLIVEQATADSAVILCIFNSGTAGQMTERLKATFDGAELRGTLSSGATINYRMRHADAIEFVWRSTGDMWMSGVLSRSDTNSTCEYERIPVKTRAKEGEVSAESDESSASLEAIVFKPPGHGPFPTLIFNHGACGSGTDTSAFKHSWTSPPLARYFTQQGYMVVFPQRQGRGKSDGLYAEGLEPDGSGYSMRPELALPGFEHALRDIEAVVEWIETYDAADASRLVMGGQSRGGLLSLAYAGANPDRVIGVINFVGGWIGESAPSAAIVDAGTFGQAAKFDKSSLWIYAESDSYYSTQHSRNNFDTFVDDGGQGDYVVVHPDTGQDGHYVVFIPSLWEDVMSRYLDSIS